MNFTKTAVIASAMLALSTQVFANNMDTMHATKVLQTKDVATKAVAYDLAFDQLATLRADSASQLNKDLGHIAPDSRSLTLEDGSYITVAEQMNVNGDTSYTGLVNVNFSYQVND